MNTKVVPTMHQWQAARDMFDSRGCTHWGSVRLIIEAFLAAAPSLEEREGDEQMNETKVVPVDAAFDALNRMQSIMMMDDGQHPRNVLRSFINAASPAPQERRVGQRRRSYVGLGEPARVKPDRRTTAPRKIIASGEVSFRTADLPHKMPSVIIGGHDHAAGAADGQVSEKSLTDNALASGETGLLPVAPALSLSQEWARSAEKQMKVNDAAPEPAPGKESNPERLTMTRKLASGVATETVVAARAYDALKRENTELRAVISARNARELVLVHENAELKKKISVLHLNRVRRSLTVPRVRGD